MLRQILFTLFTVLLIASAGEAQVNRTIDGTGNNLQNDSWGSEGATLQTLTTVGFRDGYSLPGGLDRPSPRWISNKIFAQDTLIPDPMGLSDYTWAFGQFIDHEIIAVASNRAENVSIPVNFPDPHMNPGGLFTTFIPMSRSQIVAGSGTDANNPRQYANEITSWMDGSAVYGSDDECAAWLRSFVDGKLKVSRGDLLPFNTLTGELEGDIDPSAPHMENENPFITKLFVAGDARANENPILASLHLLFVREHNRLCDELVRQHPDWTDEELYQRVRKFVGGYIQAIVFEEWLPTMGLQLPPYEGYNPDLNPNISNVFSVATFRLGHTLLNSKIVRRDNDGNKIPQGDICLKDAFFNPFVIQQVGGVDPYLKGMAVQVQQAMDIKVIDDVRNFLFGPPGSGMAGLDLAAININRGRERGLADFNTIRQDFGLTPYTSFSQISSDSATIALLQSLYSDVNQIDPWVGMLAEQPQSSNILFGETIARIMELQFMALREGDRYYYENDPALSEDDRYDIRNTTMHDVVKRNTNIDILQENVFIATPYDSICPAPLARLPMLGQIMTEDGRMLKDVDVRLDGEQPSINRAMTDSMGQFTFEGAVACGSYQLRPVKNDGISNGVSTYDLVLLSKHILGIELLDSPF
ncbi:MAG: peroxidase family protein, partial [Bacteroidota bacterium]